MKAVKIIVGLVIGIFSLVTFIQMAGQESGAGLNGAFFAFLIFGGLSAWLIYSGLKSNDTSNGNKTLSVLILCAFGFTSFAQNYHLGIPTPPQSPPTLPSDLFMSEPLQLTTLHPELDDRLQSSISDYGVYQNPTNNTTDSKSFVRPQDSMDMLFDAAINPLSKTVIDQDELFNTLSDGTLVRKYDEFLIGADNDKIQALKQAANKKRANSATNTQVYVCNGDYAYAYHRYSRCSGLNRCGGGINKVSKSSAQSSRSPCKRCY